MVIKDRISKVFDEFVSSQERCRELENLKILKGSICGIVEDSLKAVDVEITDDHVGRLVFYNCIYFLGVQKGLNDAFLNMVNKANELEKSVKKKGEKKRMIAGQKKGLAELGKVERVVAGQKKALKDIQLIHGDTNKLIDCIPDKSIDLIATDPPYEINFEGNYWDKPNQLNWHFLSKEFKRILKPSGSLIIFQGWSNVSKTKEILDKHFKIKNWIIYDRIKGRGAKTNFVSTREDILWYVANEDKYTYNKMSSTIKKKTGGMGKKNGCDYRALSNVWTDISPLVPWSSERVKHPTQKPIQIMNRIIEIHSNKNDVVFDPFFGSGTTAVSSVILKRKFIGIECNKEYYKLSKKRLEDL